MKRINYLFITLLVLGLTPLMSSAAVTSTQSVSEVSSTNPVALDLQYRHLNYFRYQLGDQHLLNEGGNGFRIGFEAFFPKFYGQIGLGFGVGAIGIKNAVVKKDTWASLIMFPLDVHMSYHLKFSQGQIVVPFVTTGPSFTFVRQTSKTGAEIDGVRDNFAWDVGGGLQFYLSALDKISAKGMRNTLGVRGTYLVLSYLRSEKIFSKENPNLSSDAFQLALRFIF